jgi:putative membrane protein
VTVQLPYCGSAPLPGELLHRFNLDPALMAALIIACAWQLWATGRVLSGARRRRAFAFAGWVIAAAAFISPLCALSVALWVCST